MLQIFKHVFSCKDRRRYSRKRAKPCPNLPKIGNYPTSRGSRRAWRTGSASGAPARLRRGRRALHPPTFGLAWGERTDFCRTVWLEPNSNITLVKKCRDFLQIFGIWQHFLDKFKSVKFREMARWSFSANRYENCKLFDDFLKRWWKKNIQIRGEKILTCWCPRGGKYQYTFSLFHFQSRFFSPKDAWVQMF